MLSKTKQKNISATNYSTQHNPKMSEFVQTDY